ncbi:MAG: hypothetical protein ACYYK0_08085 [Candidatus Eutrophobiaceae bacterium]
MFKRTTNSAEELALLQGMSEYAQAVDCFANSLSSIDWSAGQHSEYMKATGNTGDFIQIDGSKYSEQEAMAKLGAINVKSGKNGNHE